MWTTHSLALAGCGGDPARGSDRQRGRSGGRESTESIRRVRAVRPKQVAGRRRLGAGLVDLQAHHLHAECGRINIHCTIVESYRLVDCQGKIGFHSDGRGCGSTFFFELPIYTKQGSLHPVEAHEDAAIRHFDDYLLDHTIGIDGAATLKEVLIRPTGCSHHSCDDFLSLGHSSPVRHESDSHIHMTFPVVRRGHHQSLRRIASPANYFPEKPTDLDRYQFLKRTSFVFPVTGEGEERLVGPNAARQRIDGGDVALSRPQRATETSESEAGAGRSVSGGEASAPLRVLIVVCSYNHLSRLCPTSSSGDFHFPKGRLSNEQEASPPYTGGWKGDVPCRCEVGRGRRRSLSCGGRAEGRGAGDSVFRDSHGLQYGHR